VELSWSTFVLEIINFLVLVWILKRFFYKPVLEVIARRRAGIEKTLADAQALRAEAEALQEKYEGRLTDWDQDRQQAREALARELDAERSREMAELETELERKREKARVYVARREADARRTVEETALMQAAKFATRLLEGAAGPDTEARLVELVIADLTQLQPERVDAIHSNYGPTPDAIVAVSAFPLTDDQCQRLKEVLAELTSPSIPVRFEQNGELLAGLRITIGAWVMAANLRDELQGFTRLAHGE
jgi:F-type H+-transporting ATPase subunit b